MSNHNKLTKGEFSSDAAAAAAIAGGSVINNGKHRQIYQRNSSNNKNNNDNDEVETIGTSDKLQKQKKIEPKQSQSRDCQY